MVDVNQEKIKTSSPLKSLAMTQGNSNPAPLSFKNFATSQQSTLFQ